MRNIDWRPGANLEALKARAGMLARIRSYFADAGVLEVETPLAVSTSGTDPSIEPLTTQYEGPGFSDGLKLYLQSSPEFAMKRLLAADSGPIYQICKAFRNNEAGRRHNLEFSILEWYRPDFDHHQLMDEVATIARIALQNDDLPVKKIAYADLFQDFLGVDIFTADNDDLQQIAVDNLILGADGIDMDKDSWLDLLMSYLVEPRLAENDLTFIVDYPRSQASLARLNPDKRTAARFELYHQGMELANGFYELVDAQEQSQRFERENCKRKGNGQKGIKVDRHFLAALEHGLPDCSGVALGLDRLLMLAMDVDDIDAVMAFSLQRV